MKSAILLPGWEQDPNEKRYTALLDSFREAGFDARAHNPDWTKRNTQEWVDDLLKGLPANTDQLTLLGFSMGALIALLATTHIKVENLILCSASGYFGEYIPLLTQDDMKWAKENVSNFEALSATDTLARAQVEHGYIFAGDQELQEWADFRKWIDDLKTQTGWKLSVISETGHEIGAPN